MNVAYNQISCADAAKMIGVDYSWIVKLCKTGRINCTNISEGTKNGRWVISESEVNYIKTLKQKFGKDYMQKYRKDWVIGKQHISSSEKPVTIESHPVVATIKSAAVIVKEEPTKKRVDIDEVAIKIGYIQDIKDKLEALEAQKSKLMQELEDLRKEVMDVL